MKYIDNDMDDLFNKASEEYPLNTDNKNWDAVQRALAEDHDPAAVAVGKNNIRKYYPLVLLLLIPLAYIWLDNGNTQTNDEKSISSVNKNERSAAAEKKKALPVTKQDDQLTNSVTVTENKNEKAGKVKEEKNNITNSETSGTGKEDVTGKITKAGKNDIDVMENPAKKIVTINNTNGKNTAVPSPTQSKKTNSGSNNSRPVLTSIKGKSNYLSQKDTYVTKMDLLKGWSQFPPHGLYTDPSADPQTVIAGAPSLRSLEQPGSAILAPAKIKADKKLPSFYYQVKGGLDVSTVKFQEVRKPGTNISLLLGYRFSKHWSVEAGATWAVKKYYTDGKYFDKTAAGISSNIYFLNGGCYMFEFPVGVRYVSRPGKNSFFATGGLISMVMKKEGYDYKAESGGWVYDNYKDYKNSGNYLFSELQLGAGYQYKLFRGINIIIEPYLQMPLKKTGIGKMPVTSAGLHFGLLHEIR
jgi:hypothetical protein